AEGHYVGRLDKDCRGEDARRRSQICREHSWRRTSISPCPIRAGGTKDRWNLRRPFCWRKGQIGRSSSLAVSAGMPARRQNPFGALRKILSALSPRCRVKSKPTAGTRWVAPLLRKATAARFSPRAAAKNKAEVAPSCRGNQASQHAALAR